MTRHDAPRRDRSHAAARDAWPLTLALPDGRRADLVPGTRPAKYTIDGAPCDIDVALPEDLAESGWYWSGSFLYQPWPERADGPGVAICTATYPPPGYADNGRGTCFDAARRLDTKRVEVRAMLAAKPVKKAKRKYESTRQKNTAVERPTPEPSRPMLAEQMELSL